MPRQKSLQNIAFPQGQTLRALLPSLEVTKGVPSNGGRKSQPQREGPRCATLTTTTTTTTTTTNNNDNDNDNDNHDDNNTNNDTGRRLDQGRAPAEGRQDPEGVPRGARLALVSLYGLFCSSSYFDYGSFLVLATLILYLSSACF